MGAGDHEVSPTQSGARKKAETMAGRMPGTAAIKVAADDETGELEAATILARLGEASKGCREAYRRAEAVSSVRHRQTATPLSTAVWRTD
jgi:hypothetical protein